MTYDAWLERPYQTHYAQNDAYFDWCESNDLDPEEDHWDEWQTSLEDAAEDAAIARWEYERENPREDY